MPIVATNKTHYPVAHKTAIIADYELEPMQLYLSAKNPSSGAVVMFTGDVRNKNHGKDVDYLIYEAYESMACNVMEEILEESIGLWPLTYCSVIHRIGRLKISDTAVVVATASAHREAAYQANQFIIDKVKKQAPIWKNEIFLDGSSQWGNHCECH